MTIIFRIAAVIAALLAGTAFAASSTLARRSELSTEPLTPIPLLARVPAPRRWAGDRRHDGSHRACTVLHELRARAS